MPSAKHFLLTLLPQARGSLFGFGKSDSSKQPVVESSVAKYFDKSIWTPLNASARGKLWMEVAPKLGVRCPKVGMGYFYYPSLQTELRGAVATANIARGEEVCFVPVQQMLSEFSVGNSSLLGLMRNYIARSPKGKVSTASSVTMKAVIAVFVIREGARCVPPPPPPPPPRPAPPPPPSTLRRACTTIHLGAAF